MCKLIYGFCIVLYPRSVCLYRGYMPIKYIYLPASDENDQQWLPSSADQRLSNPKGLIVASVTLLSHMNNKKKMDVDTGQRVQRKINQIRVNAVDTGHIIASVLLSLSHHSRWCRDYISSSDLFSHTSEWCDIFAQPNVSDVYSRALRIVSILISFVCFVSFNIIFIHCIIHVCLM